MDLYLPAVFFSFILRWGPQSGFVCTTPSSQGTVDWVNYELYPSYLWDIPKNLIFQFVPPKKVGR